MEDQLSPEERLLLLMLARQAIRSVICGEELAPLDYALLPARFHSPGATFVTLTRNGDLRGCIGALEPYLPLAEDVRQHAIAAAVEDYRFLPITPDELGNIDIEISVLTRPQPLEYEHPEDLPTRLRPGVDGVTLRDGFQRATFLPQVWEKLPDPALFLSHLCQKMGAPANLWRHKKLNVQTYQVEEFHDERPATSGLPTPAQNSPR